MVTVQKGKERERESVKRRVCWRNCAPFSSARLLCLDTRYVYTCIYMYVCTVCTTESVMEILISRGSLVVVEYLG